MILKCTKKIAYPEVANEEVYEQLKVSVIKACNSKKLSVQIVTTIGCRNKLEGILVDTTILCSDDDRMVLNDICKELNIDLSKFDNEEVDIFEFSV